MVKTYELWSDVKGARVDSYSTDPDVMVDAYVDGKTGYLILNNLKFELVTIDLSYFGLGSTSIQKVDAKHLYLNGDGCEIDVNSFDTAPASVILESEGTMILAYSFTEDVQIDQTSAETKHYADIYLKTIEANKVNQFKFSGLATSQFGEAVLRVGVGRNHGKELFPAVAVNGTQVDVPTNYRGDDQADRATFFGVLEIPVPKELITENMTVDITFPDNGGHISSVTIRNFNFSREIVRSSNTITAIDDFREMGHINVYPIPTKNKLNIDISEHYLGANYVLVNQVGKTMNSGRIRRLNNQLDISNLTKGMYLMNVSKDSQRFTQKVLVN